MRAGFTAKDLTALVTRIMGEPVIKVTAPGGRGRASVRVHLADRTIIATRRDDPTSGEHEAAFQKVMHRFGAPVPRVFGYADGVMLQQDAGRVRLSIAMTRADQDTRTRLAKRAFDDLERLKACAHATGLTTKLPLLGGSAAWLDRFAGHARDVSERLGIAPPAWDDHLLRQRLGASPQEFVRWDARPGNVGVQPDSGMLWYDWEVFGLRSGVEDFAWLIADETWLLSRAETLDSLAHLPRFSTPERVMELGLYVTMFVINRVRIILNRVEDQGWAKGEHALRHDTVAATPEVLRMICARAAEWSGADAELATVAPWLERAEYALLQQHQRTG